jgi:hypothetical protein
MKYAAWSELTGEENEIIFEARACGYAAYFPAYPDVEAQARRTLAGALRWLQTHHVPVSPDDPGVAPPGPPDDGMPS